MRRIRPLFDEGRRKYVAGLMLQHPEKAWASDANFTIRLTYGRVLPYEPADGIEYSYYTTLKGVMEKEDPKNPAEFFVPERLKELYAAKDFGRYADRNGELPTCFLQVAFEPELQRTIAVDIRYVLFTIDKFAGAGWLLDELDIVK